MGLPVGRKEGEIKRNEEIKGQEGRKCDTCYGRERRKEKRGQVFRKSLSMKERRQEGRTYGHKLSEREEENKERKEQREREIVDVEVRK